MDLGFGDSNQIIGSAVATNLLRSTQAQEEAIQSEISKYDALLESHDSELEALREKRLSQMKKAADQRSKWIENGHGVYSDLEGVSGQHGGDVAKAFFEAAKKSSRMVVHFHRPTTRNCDVFHRALTELAPKHPETRFLKINVEGCDDVRESGSGVGAKYLVEKLGIVVMPTLLIVKDRKASHQLRGFDELGGREDFSVVELAYVLGGHGALTRRDDEEAEPKFLGETNRGVVGMNSLRMQFGEGRRGPRSGGFSDDFDED
ncbi:hypothetical protein HJC23_010235 [Cyclotella cryptica]|uniref:Thioredoxin domain-containing protein n=1 Tax=Cyclotella cryptica TaxID=29204 RepID=A0ABD3Q014_9STRA|eukprot:CCRYP_009849-RA/>CCRYP_009849-RA protein AED:0.18 eAED:0.18 QI:0/-1/0/1/-1/1/1/0/260